MGSERSVRKILVLRINAKIISFISDFLSIAVFKSNVAVKVGIIYENVPKTLVHIYCQSGFDSCR